MTKRVDAWPRPISGIIPPIVTPLSGAGALDVAGLEKLIEYVLAGGVHGIFVLGTTGEGPSLSYDLRCQMIRRTCKQVAGRVPVLVGVAHPSSTDLLSIAHEAADSGADVLVLGPPYYFPLSQQELLGYLRRIIPELGLPVLLYNMPVCREPAFAVETVKAAADHPNVVGIKDSSGDFDYFTRLATQMKDRPDFSALIGSEDLFIKALQLGAHGDVSGMANLVPNLVVRIYETFRDGDEAGAKSLHDRLMTIDETVFQVAQGISGFIAALKHALSCIRICSELPAEPISPLTEDQRALIRQRLHEQGITSAL